MVHPSFVGILLCIVWNYFLRVNPGQKCTIVICSISSTNPSQQLRTWMLEHDQPPYRAAQIRKWVFEKRADSWEQMTDLPRGLREQLASEFDIWSAEIAVHRKDDDGTEKLLLTLADGRQRSRHDGAVRPARRRIWPQADGTRRVPATIKVLRKSSACSARRQRPLQHVHQHAGRLCDEVRFLRHGLGRHDP